MMKHPAVRLFAAFLAAALPLFAGGCGGSEPVTYDDELVPADVQPQHRDEAEAKPVTIQAENPQWEKIVKTLTQGRTVEEQQKIYEAQQHYERAMGYHKAGDFEKAKVEAQLAIQAWPGHLEARRLLADVQQVIIGGAKDFGARSIGEAEKRDWMVRIEQAQIEITKHVRDGERFFNARMFKQAAQEFENAEFKILHIPYDVKAMNDLLPSVRSYLQRARNAEITEGKAIEEEKKRMAEAEAFAHEVAVKREVTRKMAHLLEMAYMAFDQRRYEQCQKLCDELLIIDPHYTVARELKEDAIKTYHKDQYYDILERKVQKWKELTNSDEEAVVPYAETVRFPSRREWAEISKRITEKIIRQGGGTGDEGDADILAIERKLETMKIDMAFENSKLEDILAFIRDFTGLNILIDASVRDSVDLEKPVSFKVKELVLESVLKLLLAQFGLDHRITEEKVVLITTPEKAGGKVVLELHDIRDIMVKLQDFAGPKVELVSPSAQGGPLTGATFTLDEPREASVGEEQIIDLIMENIAPGMWDADYSIERTPNQQLLVSAPPKVHTEIREFIAKLRSYTGTMVSVVCRFVAAYDDFLDDLGVDIIRRANANLPGHDIPGAALTNIDEWTGEVGPGFTTNESARLESYDLRGQTFHTLVRFDPLTQQGVNPLDNRQVDQGGLGLQYEWLGEQALGIVLRALHKSNRGTVVQAPRITVFNTQRSHVMFLSQLAYIQDYEPQVSTLAAAYDPVISVLTHGAVLDVRPIVSNDRKYVTLEMRPSLAEFQTFRQIDIRPGFNIILQLPWVVLQKAEATVTVPDRGTIVLSGFKDILMRDLHSGVPFLEHIPVLNFFFTRKGKTDEKRRLLMLVTPEIIDLGEYEDRQF